MSQNNLIVIFNKDLSIAALITVTRGDLEWEYFESPFAMMLQEFKKFIENNKPKVCREIFDPVTKVKNIILEEVAKDNYFYPTAIVEEVGARGLLAVNIPPSLKDLLLLLNQKGITPAQRQAVVPELVNLRGDDAEQASQAIAGIMTTLKEIKENREKWDAFLKAKAKEILGDKN